MFKLSTFRKVLLMAAFLFTAPWARGEFELSTQSICYGDASHIYFFSSTSYNPDVKIKVSASAYPFDLVIKIVETESEADLVILDDKYGPMRVCKKNVPTGAQVVKLSASETEPDLTIKVSEYALNPDYKLYNDSKRFKHVEAAAIFALMWKYDRERFLANLTK